MRIHTEAKQEAASKNLSNNLIGGQHGRLNGTATIVATLAIILAMAGLSSCGSTASASHPVNTTTTPTQETAGPSTPATGTLSPNATSLAFGNVSVGSTGVQTVTITNSGTATVDISQVAVSGTGMTIIAGNASGASLAAAASIAVQVQFAPQAAGAVTGSLVITNDGAAPSVAISLTATGTQAPQAQVTATPSMVAFGSVVDGTTNSQTISIKNTGNASLTLSQDSVTGTGFTISGLSLQTIPAGSSVTFNAVFSPTTTGAVSGTISIVSNAGNSPFAISLSGTGTQAPQAQVTATPSTIAFGSVVDGTTNSQTISIKNTGNADLTLSQDSVTGTGFTISGLSLQTIPAGSSVTFNAVFSPTTTGTVSGSISIVSNAGNSPFAISLSGTGTQAPQAQVTATPSTIAFGSVVDGTTNSQTISIKNTGNADLTLSQDSVTGTGFTISGLSLQTIPAGSSVTFNAVFSPTTTGTVSGSISIVSNAGNSPFAISLSGTGTQAPQAQVTATPSTIAFGSVVDGTTNSQTISIKNTGNADLTLSQDSVTGTGFTISGLSLQTIPAGSSVTFNAVFSPTTTGAVSGSISIVSNAGNSPFAISLSGTGTAAVASLSASPASVNFGNITPGNTTSQNVTLTNTGNANVTISGVNVTGAGLSDSGVSSNMTLQPNQSVTLTATFSPTSTGSTTGNIMISSNAASSTIISLSGTSHTVNLVWNASTSTDVAGYNVYRGTTLGQYTRISSSTVGATQFTDATVQGNKTYYYAVTSVDSNNMESADSSDVVVVLP